MSLRCTGTPLMMWGSGPSVRAKLVLLAAKSHTNRKIAERVDMAPDRANAASRRYRPRRSGAGLPRTRSAPGSSAPGSFPATPTSSRRRAGCSTSTRTYHSIIQRKVLDPNDFQSTAEVARTLNEFERRYNEIAEPFDWVRIGGPTS